MRNSSTEFDFRPVYNKPSPDFFEFKPVVNNVFRALIEARKRRKSSATAPPLTVIDESIGFGEGYQDNLIDRIDNTGARADVSYVPTAEVIA